MARKGIILSGGLGTRLYPITISVSKQLLPVYDKPMIYYSLSTLMFAGIRDILIIVKDKDVEQYQHLLGNGSNLGINISYIVQKYPGGIAQAFVIGRDFIGQSRSALILGDNIFYGSNFPKFINEASLENDGATIFAYSVKNPQHYGVVEFDKNKVVTGLIEKPQTPKSNYAVTGLYFYDKEATSLVKEISPSARGELEIIDLSKLYMAKNALKLKILDRGSIWFDAGTHESLLSASQYVASIENRQGAKICCPEEIAWRKGFIDDEQLARLLHTYPPNSGYTKYLMSLLKEQVDSKDMSRSDLSTFA